MCGCLVTADEEWSGEWMENVETNRIREGRMEFFSICTLHRLEEFRVMMSRANSYLSLVCESHLSVLAR
jgi:hypothetical protein